MEPRACTHTHKHPHTRTHVPFFVVVTEEENWVGWMVAPNARQPHWSRKWVGSSSAAGRAESRRKREREVCLLRGGRDTDVKGRVGRLYVEAWTCEEGSGKVERRNSSLGFGRGGRRKGRWEDARRVSSGARRFGGRLKATKRLLLFWKRTHSSTGALCLQFTLSMDHREWRGELARNF